MLEYKEEIARNTNLKNDKSSLGMTLGCLCKYIPQRN